MATMHLIEIIVIIHFSLINSKASIIATANDSNNVETEININVTTFKSINVQENLNKIDIDRQINSNNNQNIQISNIDSDLNHSTIITEKEQSKLNTSLNRNNDFESDITDQISSAANTTIEMTTSVHSMLTAAENVNINNYHNQTIINDRLNQSEDFNILINENTTNIIHDNFINQTFIHHQITPENDTNTFEKAKDSIHGNHFINLINDQHCITCEYGAIRKYSIRTLIEWRTLSLNLNEQRQQQHPQQQLLIRLTLIMKCLNNFDKESSMSGHHKFIAIINDFHIEPFYFDDYPFIEDNVDDNNNNLDFDFNNNNIDDAKSVNDWFSIEKLNHFYHSRKKRSLFDYFEQIWNNFNHLLSSNDNLEQQSPRSMKNIRNAFDNDMIMSMENDLENSKCMNKQKNSNQYQNHENIDILSNEKLCIDCSLNANPFIKISLPFWFIQMNDGQIRQIQFLKQDSNNDIKNLKKYLLSLLQFNCSAITQNANVNELFNESNWFGNRSFHYQVNNISNVFDIVKHIHFDHDELNNLKPILLIKSNQTFKFDANKSIIVDSVGNFTFNFDQQRQLNELSPFIDGRLYYELKMIPSIHGKHDDSIKLLNEHFLENTHDESIVMIDRQVKQETILMEKYTKLLWKLRSKLGKNEYRYYTTLYEAATSKMDSQEHDLLLTLITLEQQLLNHTKINSYDSIIGDIRRIGTAHNIQLVCGINLQQIVANKHCQAFIQLLLKCSSKTAQRDILYALQQQQQQQQNQTLNYKSKNDEMNEIIIKLLSFTQRPSRWFIENLLHELYYRQNEQEKLQLLKSLILLARNNEQLIKLNDILCTFVSKQYLNQINHSVDYNHMNQSMLIDLMKIITNLNNDTIIDSVIENLFINQTSRLSSSIIVAIIHSYRNSIHKLNVQNSLLKIFQTSHHSCRIRQEILQLLIDYLNHQSKLQPFEQDDKSWPKYEFNNLDQIFADNLRNSSNNCLHRLIIEYFDKKVNVKSKKYLNQYKSRQNFDSLSFDYCLNELNTVNCDYVQKIGNDLFEIIVIKSIQIPKLFKSSNYDRLKFLSTKYSFNLNVSSADGFNHNNQLTVGYLNVHQAFINDSNQFIQIDFNNYKGQIIDVFNMNFSSINNDLGKNNDVQLKLNLPTIILWNQYYPHQLFYAKTMNINLLIKFMFLSNLNHKENQSSNEEIKFIKISFNINTNIESMMNNLIWKNSVELESRFQYESIQPIAINHFKHYRQHSRKSINDYSIDEAKQSNGLNHTNEITTFNSTIDFLIDNVENSLLNFGTEWFHHEIELFHEFNKRYDTKCNQWIDKSYHQTLTLWNSTLLQKNLISNSLYDNNDDQQQQLYDLD